ncbi:MAG TPA: hypothetical protein VKW08_16615 [Xanthobacteraceae bacterium]|jgi:hypothetical protein|nr:hypothetical protein [Xanthobacteraceae bacterium]
MWSQPKTDARSLTARALALACFAATLAGCSDIYFDRRETIALGADDHIAANEVGQMVDPWPRYVDRTNIAFNGERMQSAVERYRRHEVIQPMPLTNSASTEQHAPPPLTTEHVPVQPAASTPAAQVK